MTTLTVFYEPRDVEASSSTSFPPDTDYENYTYIFFNYLEIF